MSAHQPAAPPTLDPASALMLGALACLWGGTYVLVGIAVREVTPLTLVLSRLVLGAAALHLVRAARGLAVPPPLWPRLAVMAFVNNAVPFCLIFWAQTRIPAGLASILNAATPAFSVLVAHLARQEGLSANRLGGVLAGFLGVAVLIGPVAFAGGGDVWAELACLGAALSYAVSGAYARARLSGIPPLVLAAGQLTAAAAMVAPAALALEAPWTLPVPSMRAIGAMLALALASTALACLLFFRILARAGATNLLLVTFLIPVVAVLLGALILGETLGLRECSGFLLIAVGLAAIDGRLLRRS